MISALNVDHSGKTLEKVKLPEAIFGVKTDQKQIAQAVRVYLSNQRSASAKTKTRSEVEKTTAKMYRQKGTGRARHGSYSAPIFVGGGVSGGPDGNQNYKKSMSKTMNRGAFLGSLSEKAADGKITIISDEDKLSGKTKEAKALVSGLVELKQRLLVVVGLQQKKVAKAFRNVADVIVVTPNQLNTYIVLVSQKVLFTSGAMEETKKLFKGE